MRRRFEFVGGTSKKFWEIEVKGDRQIICFGRLGAAGQVQEKRFASPVAAQAACAKVVAEKVRKGYVEIGTRDAAGKGAVALPKQMPPLVKQAIRQHGVEKYAELIAEGLEPAVRMVIAGVAAKRTPVGASRFGGEPDLADPAEWPMHPEGRPMGFLAQIRLSELPRGHVSAMLPKQGWLRFWQDSLGDWLSMNTITERQREQPPSEGLVTFEPDEKRVLRRCTYPAFPEPKIPARRKVPPYVPPSFKPWPEARPEFRPVWSMERGRLHQFVREIDASDPDTGWEHAMGFYHAIQGDSSEGNHRLLGGEYEIMSGDMREICCRMDAQRRGKRVPQWGKTSEKEKDCWRLLAKFDSDTDLGWVWSDMGSLFYWIKEEDLRTCRFENAVAMVAGGG